MKFNHTIEPVTVTINHGFTLDIGERAAQLGQQVVGLGYAAIDLVRELHARPRRRSTFDIRSVNFGPYGGSVQGDSTLLNLLLLATQYAFLPLVVTDAEGNIIEGAVVDGVTATSATPDVCSAAIVSTDDAGNEIPQSVRVGTEGNVLGLGQILLSDGDPAKDIVINVTVAPGAPAGFALGAPDIRENVAPAPPADPGEGGETPPE